MTRTDKRLFYRKTTELIQNLGGRPDGEYWHLSTSCGPLRILINDDIAKFERRGVGTVFARFGDVERAKTKTDCDDRGNWNHFYCNADVLGAIKDLTEQLTKIGA